MKSYSDQLKDPKWQKKRLEVLERARWTCRQCRSGKITLHVHHLYYVKGVKPWDYPDGALVVLCEDCHKERHSLEEKFDRLFRARFSNDGLHWIVDKVSQLGKFTVDLQPVTDKPQEQPKPPRSEPVYKRMGLPADVQEMWSKLLGKCKVWTRTMLAEAAPVSLDNTYLTVGFHPAFAGQIDLVNTPERVAELRQHLAVLGYPAYGIKFVVNADAPSPEVPR